MDQDLLRKEKTKNHGQVRKALVIQGSPRGQRGWTDHCLKHFLPGLQENGVSCEVIYLHKLKLKHCVGCYNCWFKTPGVCAQKDDMAGLLGKLNDADLWVFAVPLYFYSVTGLFKDFLDRTIPLALPYMNQDPKGLTDHPPRNPEPKRLVLLSVCGLPELDHFSALRDMFARAFPGEQTALVGELLRPAAETMTGKDRFLPAYEKSMQALSEAGRELTRQGFVSQATEQAVATPFFEDPAQFRETVNRFMEARLAQLEKKPN